MITGDINAHSTLWHSYTDGHSGKIIADIINNSDNITLNTDTPTREPNTTLQQTSSKISPRCPAHYTTGFNRFNKQLYIHTTYPQQIHTWTKDNNLMPKPDKATCTLFTPDPAEYNTNLHLHINNTTLPMNTHPKILGVTLHPKLTYNTYTALRNKPHSITQDTQQTSAQTQTPLQNKT